MRGPYRPRTYRIINTKYDYLVAVRRFPIRTGRTVARMIGRILLALAVLAVTGFVFLVLIGLWDRYEQEITAGLSRIYERYLAWQAGFSGDAPTRTFQQLPKLVGTGAVGSTNQGMSVALSADGNTAIVGGPGPNNADRDRPSRWSTRRPRCCLLLQPPS